MANAGQEDGIMSQVKGRQEEERRGGNWERGEEKRRGEDKER